MLLSDKTIEMLDESGRNTTIWPGTTSEFRRETRRVDLAEYAVLRSLPTAAKDDRENAEVTA